MIFVSAIIVLLLIAFSSYLSALETSIVAASPGRIHKSKNASKKKTTLLLKLLKDRNKIISTILVMFSIVNTVATTLATGVIMELVGGEYGIAASSAIMSVLLIIFAEVLPKSIGVSKAEQIALKGAGFIKSSLYFMFPINFAINKIIKLFCFIFRVNLNSEISAADEVRGVIEHYHQEGNVKKYDRDMLGGVLDLRHITVEEVMIHRSQIVSINIDQNAGDIITQALNSPHTRIPLWRETKDNIVGILHLRSILKALHKNKYNFNKIDISSYITEPWFVPENAPLSKQLTEFKDRRSHMAIVVDEYGDIIGILTLEDILEEVVGQIEDEIDVAPSKIIKKNENMYLVDGTASIRDINRELNLQLNGEDAHTISGMFMHHLERLPNVGDVIHTSGAKMTIVKKHTHKIKQVLIEILQLEESHDDHK
ncbi:MAG: CNNM domain-containing protein [Rickettsiaceae bacterium]|nr:CNNM domain-containing protein [Rickettsiaceae bacterium]